MDNQHRKITGYRELNEAEVAQMNEVKHLAEICGEMINSLDSMPDADRRSVALAKTNLQQGFMWAVRAVAKPSTF